MPTGELLAGYAATLAELRARGVLRTANAPAGDYGEWLVARAFGVELEANSAKSYDLVLDDGRRVQVKTRVVSDPPRNGQLQTSVFRSWGFDLAGLVLLREEDYHVVRAVLLPRDVVQQRARRSEHVNGASLQMTPELLRDPAAEDVTERLRQAALRG
ncbi:DUF6998 domain-containing protein [Motilibacter deserti]|uniref:DUF6998 domain-containing protein n=1 Tax=Motilibacter deserti TaxID=2714956 RepID=A0ABX0GS38_9ACTN|nr:hypothetical protein [Motilibacter deserti]NHC13677.1 hypothetical protein [Motilibacter deserti]